MDQEPPVRRNTFVLVAVILFNLIWITLLFWSCQADSNSNPTPTPEAGIIDQDHWNLITSFESRPILEEENQTRVVVECVSRQNLHLLRLIAESMSYNVPLYNPPSTCNITPVI